MQANGVMEPLRPATTEEIKQLIHFYEQRLPEAGQFALLLQHISRVNSTLRGDDLEKVSDRYRKTIYVPKTGNLQQFATFLVISLGEDPFVFMHSMESPPIELSTALRNTCYVKWEIQQRVVIGGYNEIRDCLHQTAMERKLHVEAWSECLNYWMLREEAANLTYAVPNDVELRPLKIEHGVQLNECWPFRYKTSQRYIESSIQHNAGLGLFDRITGQLVSWVFKNDHDAIGHLYTIPDRNNRGYGTTLAKAITRLIAADHKQHVHTFISESNTRSIRLFEKIGYTAVGQTEWYIVG
uniref:N-acetyltransferase domain-containing protein n=1 Tax=Anopheles dirus TaxID=7168 RepID=A0A182NNP3_9DIPT